MFRARYKCLSPFRNAREHNRRDVGSPCRAERRGTGGKCGPRCQHIIDQKDRAAGDPRHPPRGAANRPGHIGKAAGPVAPLLTACGAGPMQQIDDTFDPGFPRQRLREQGRLIVTPQQQPAPVKRHGRDQRVRKQERFRRLFQPAPRWTMKFGPVAVLERQNKTPARPGIGEDRPRPAPNRRYAEAAVAKHAVFRPARQGQSAGIADQTVEKIDIPPAVRAKAEVLRNRCGAGHALGRIERVQSRAPAPRDERLQSAEPAPRFDRFQGRLMHQPPQLTDRPQLLRQRERARRGQPALFLHEAVADEVQERLTEVNRRFTNPAIVTAFPEAWHAFPTARFVADEDVLDLEEGAHDLLIHDLALHWSSDPVGQLVQARRALRPDGLFLGALFAGQTLSELRAVMAEAEVALTGGLSPRVAPMGEIRDLGGLLHRAGLALPVADGVKLTVTYGDVMALFRDLRAMGETNALAARRKTMPPRVLFPLAAEIYERTYALPDGRLPATFEIVYLTGWAPDASQQQPLRPGTALQRLEDALNAPRDKSTS